MLNLKKVIALVCVFALALTTVAFGATYADVPEDSAYYEAVETLTKLGIVEGDDNGYRPEDGVTRAEMAALIARIQGYGETAKAAANTNFTDVPSTHWASGFIANAAGMGIINGYGDGNFGPEDPVLYEQAIKMVMATLGYTPFAEKNGGYPTGYLAAAQRYNVALAVANAAVGQEANRGTVAQILANAIDTPLMIQAGWNTNGEVEYKIAEGELVTEYIYDATMNGGAGGYYPATTTKGYKTLMSENLGYVKIRGILYANDYTSIYGSKTIDTNEPSKVWIAVVDDYGTENKKFAQKANNEYLVGDLDAEGLLGRSVIAYTKANAKDEFELLSVAVDTNRNKELVIDLDQYDAGGVASVSGGVVTAISDVAYYKEGANDTTDIKIEAGAVLVVNGVYTAITSSVDIATEVSGITAYGGTIKFIDNDESNGYDVVFVDYAATGVVDEVGKSKVTFKNLVAGAISRDSIKYDLEDESKVLIVKKDGEVIDVADLAEWDIVSIYATGYNANYIVMEVIGTQITGTVASTKNSNTSATGTAYRIDGTWYDAAEGHFDADKLEINLGGTIYIDEFGKIAAFVEDGGISSSAKYGFVLGASAKAAEFGGSTPDIKLQVLTADGVKIMPLKNNFRLEANGASDAIVDLTNWTVSATGVVSGDSGYWSTINGYIGAVVRYEANADGVITKLTEEGHDGVSNAKFNVKTLGATDLEFDAENNKFTLTTGSGANDAGNTAGGYVEADTIVFVVDATRSGGSITGYDADDCAVATLADLNDKDTVDVLASYMDAKADTVNIIVVEKASLAVSTTANIAVVKEVSSATNDADESILEITYLANGEEVTAKTTADAATAAASWISEGDIAKIKVGSNGLISSVAAVYDFGAAYEVSDDNQDGATAGNGDADDVWVAIRDKNLASDNATVLATAVLAAGTNEVFDGGVVTGYNKKTQEATINGGSTYKLSTKGANVYVIDVTGNKTIIEAGSYGDFGYFAALYDGTNGNLYKANNSTAIHSGMTDAVAQTYADHVYVRTYEDKVTDVVIVKGSIDDAE